jgi:hypothetical protein
MNVQAKPCYATFDLLFLLALLENEGAVVRPSFGQLALKSNLDPLVLLLRKVQKTA